MQQAISVHFLNALSLALLALSGLLLRPAR
jgi:hypothetical protein